MQVLELLPPRTVSIQGTYTVLKVDNRRLIGGYASVEVRDSQGEIITVSALKEALEKFLAAKDYRNVHVMHSNVEVGKLLAEAVTDSEGNTWQTHVDDIGLFAVCEINRPITATDRVWDAIERGELGSYSVGGEAIHRSGPEGDIIDKLELHEITICVKGSNAPAKFVIIKAQPIPEAESDSIILKQYGRSFLLLPYPSHAQLGKTVESPLEQRGDVTPLKERGEETETETEEKKKMSKEEQKAEPDKKADPVTNVAPEVLELKAAVEKLLAEIAELKAAAAAKKADPVPAPAPATIVATPAPAPAPPGFNMSEFMKSFVSELVKSYPGEKRTVVPNVGTPGKDLSEFNVSDEQLLKESWRETEARLHAAKAARVMVQ